MKSFSRVLAIAGLGLGFAFAANAATVRSTVSFEGDLMQCGGCGKGKKEGDKKEEPKQQSALVGGLQADVVHCGHCGKDKKECPKDGDKKEGEKKTSTMSNLGDCNKDKKDDSCPDGGCGKKKQN